MQRRPFSIVVLLLAVITMFFSAPVASAQDTTVRWTEAEPLLYMPKGDNGTIPYVFTGPSNNTYLLFFGRPENDDSGLYSLYYSRWEDGDWLPIKDVVVNPGGGMPETAVGVEDALGYLHVFWISAGAWYSRVHVSEAEDARSWTQPTAVFDQGQALSLDVVADDDNSLHLIVTTTDRNVYAMSIFPDGRPDTPVLIYQTNTHFPYYPSLVMTNSDKLIGCWNDVNGDEDGRADGFYCSSSTDRGVSWSPPEMIADGHRWGGLFYFPQTDTLARIIGGGNGVGGRTIELSQDDGLSWSPPADLTQGVDMQGYNNHVAAMDSAGVIHVLVNPGDGRHVHSSLQGANWTPNIPAGWVASDWINLAVAQGSTLVATWWVNNTIFVAAGATSAPLAPPQMLPAPPRTSGDSSASETTPAAAEASVTVNESVENTPQRILSSLSFVQSLGRTTILLVSILPALMLVLMVIVVRMVRLRR